jgi:NADH-quinone oxidoreductase subunit G
MREAVIEWLMIHHPHDCPVCDEGGECQLQDMTVMAGHSLREYRFRKRTFRDQDLGPFVNQEMNRCIQCYRCVRFYRDYAGGRDFDAFFLRDRVFFGRHEDGTLESEFSGNLVEVCPTGVFTDKTLKPHFTRKWDERTAPSVCVHCSIGCNTIPGERYGVLRRIRTRFNGEVNGYFLCDRGRYGYAFVNSERRLRSPFVRGAPAGTTTRRIALERAASFLATGTRAIGIGSPRASLEANFALRALVGPDRFFSGMAEPEHAMVSTILHVLRDGPVRSASLHDVELSDAVFVLGEDVTNTAPMLALALRQSVRRQPMGTTPPYAPPCRERGGHSSSRRSRTRVWTTSRRPHFMAHQTMSPGSDSTLPTHSIPVHLVPAPARRLTQRSLNESPAPCATRNVRSSSPGREAATWQRSKRRQMSRGRCTQRDVR